MAMQDVPTRGWARCAFIVSGYCAGMVAHVSCDPDGREDPCAVLDDVHTVVLGPGPYHVGSTDPDLLAMEESSAVVVEDETITLTWDEDGVAYRIAWQLGPFEWVADD